MPENYIFIARKELFSNVIPESDAITVFFPLCGREPHLIIFERKGKVYLPFTSICQLSTSIVRQPRFIVLQSSEWLIRCVGSFNMRDALRGDPSSTAYPMSKIRVRVGGQARDVRTVDIPQVCTKYYRKIRLSLTIVILVV